MLKIILLFLGVILALPVTAQTITISNGEWSPWMSESLKYNGVASRIIKEAFALEGILVNYVFYPWKRSYNLAVDGQVVGSAIWTKTPEREKILYYSDPIVRAETVFFHLKSKPISWVKLEDLHGKHVVSVSGYNYGDEFANAIKAKILESYESVSDETALTMLSNGRADLFISDKDVGIDVIRKIFNPQQQELITYFPKLVTSVDMFLVLSKKVPGNEQLLITFNRGLKKLKEQGKVEQYLKESREGAYYINK